MWDFSCLKVEHTVLTTGPPGKCWVWIPLAHLVRSGSLGIVCRLSAFPEPGENPVLNQVEFQEPQAITMAILHHQFIII